MRIFLVFFVWEQFKKHKWLFTYVILPIYRRIYALIYNVIGVYDLECWLLKGTLWCSGKSTRLIIRRVFPARVLIPLMPNCDEDGVSFFSSTPWPDGDQ